MCICIFVDKKGRVRTINIEITQPILLSDLLSLEILKINLSENHACFREMRPLRFNDIIQPADRLAFLLPAKLDATTWRKNRLQNKDSLKS
jgi:hypothetical protein